MQPDLSDLCALIRERHRERSFALEQRKRADLALLAFLRTQLGWRLDLPAGERSAIAARAMKIVAAARRSGDTAPEDGLELIAKAALLAREPFARIEASAAREMRKLARRLPVWKAWAKEVRGLAEVGLAQIVAEAGDLSMYDRESQLWKRMGLAVLGPGDGLRDHRQGDPPKNASPEARKNACIAEGYSPRRRSVRFVIGDALIKTSGPYRDIYLKRKAYEVERAQALGLTVAPAAKITKKMALTHRSVGHVHRRAQRYMEKRLLRHLWRAWRRETGHSSHADLPAVTLVPSLAA